MLVDWFTVVAQALNFLVLVWLMKRFLYQPILRAIDERERRIAAQLAQAEAMQAEAAEQRAGYQRLTGELEQQRAEALAQAAQQASAERERLIGQARAAADAWTALRQQALQNEARDLQQALVRRAQEQVFAIARKALADLASASLEERLAEVLTRHLRELGAEAQAQLAAALRSTSAALPAVVRSAFELPAAQRAAIQRSLDDRFEAGIVLRFETAPQLVCGIELTAGGQKVAWSIADYLTSLQQAVDELVRRPTEPAPLTQAP